MVMRTSEEVRRKVAGRAVFLVIRPGESIDTAQILKLHEACGGNLVMRIDKLTGEAAIMSDRAAEVTTVIDLYRDRENDARIARFEAAVRADDLRAARRGTKFGDERGAWAGAVETAAERGISLGALVRGDPSLANTLRSAPLPTFEVASDWVEAATLQQTLANPALDGLGVIKRIRESNPELWRQFEKERCLGTPESKRAKEILTLREEAAVTLASATADARAAAIASVDAELARWVRAAREKDPSLTDAEAVRLIYREHPQLFLDHTLRRRTARLIR